MLSIISQPVNIHTMRLIFDEKEDRISLILRLIWSEKIEEWEKANETWYSFIHSWCLLSWIS